jgi:hypothetical protein
MHVGDIWARRVRLGDAYDVVRVVAKIELRDEPVGWSITPAEDFGPVVETDPDGITEHCDLITSGDPDYEWRVERGA